MEKEYPFIQFQIAPDAYNSLRFGLCHNAKVYGEWKGADANAIMNTIDKYARVEHENGEVFVNIDFSKADAQQLILQFLLQSIYMERLLSEDGADELSLDYFSMLKSLIEKRTHQS